MGTSQAYNYKTGRWALDCGQCGTVGGVRKRSCPSNWCPPVQMCATCYKDARMSGQWAQWHDTCVASSAEYHAREAAKNAEPERWARAAWGTWHTETTDVLVKTRAGNFVLINQAAYRPEEPLDAQGAVPWHPSSGIRRP